MSLSEEVLRLPKSPYGYDIHCVHNSYNFMMKQRCNKISNKERKFLFSIDCPIPPVADPSKD